MLTLKGIMQKTMDKQKRRKSKTSYIGANIKAARDAKGFSQLELAHKCGYKGDDAGAQLCRIENGKTQPRFTTLIKLSKALGVTVESLVTEKKKLDPREY